MLWNISKHFHRNFSCDHNQRCNGQDSAGMKLFGSSSLPSEPLWDVMENRLFDFPPWRSNSDFLQEAQGGKSQRKNYEKKKNTCRGQWNNVFFVVAMATRVKQNWMLLDRSLPFFSTVLWDSTLETQNVITNCPEPPSGPQTSSLCSDTCQRQIGEGNLKIMIWSRYWFRLFVVDSYFFYYFNCTALTGSHWRHLFKHV